MTKALKAQWKELADDRRRPYQGKEAEEIKRYNEECKAAGIETLEEKAKKDAEKAAKKAEKDAERERKKAQKV